MIILALNCGSSSVKYQLYNWEKKTTLVKGVVERVGIANSFISHCRPGKEEIKLDSECKDHATAIQLIVSTILDPAVGAIKNITEIQAVGHRVVHGGEKFKSSVKIDPQVKAAIKDMCDLAPLHNPHNLAGIEAAERILPNVPHIAVFDTAFHQTMPQAAYTYAVPYEWYPMYGVRRYGFHGTSHLYVSRRAAVLLGKKPADINLITLHIGNGVSLTAVKNGQSFDTSMGLTPLEGAVMGSRCGDIDPAIILFMIEKEGFYVEELDAILNKKSGLLGITGKHLDRRDIQKGIAEGDARCLLAEDIEAYRLKKYIGAYAAALGKVDALVFTAGAGELNYQLREKVLQGLEKLGIILDVDRNRGAVSREEEILISADNSPVKVFVIPTNEEIVFIEDVVAILEDRYKVHTEFTYCFEDPNYKKPRTDQGPGLGIRD
jgi:acetate kinase